MQRWCNIPCLIRCNIFASTAFSCMFKMFFEIWGGDAVTWVSGGVVMLSVLNTKCFIYSSYEILHSDRSKHIFIRESVVCRCYNINDYTATMLLLFILEICCWQTGVFQGRFSFFHPTYRQNESQVDESSFQFKYQTVCRNCWRWTVVYSFFHRGIWKCVLSVFVDIIIWTLRRECIIFCLESCDKYIN